jgi:hypothetical protein
MEYFAAIDVSLELSSVCVVDAAGRIVREAKAASEPEALVRGVVQIRVTREAGLTPLRRLVAPSYFQRWCAYGSRWWCGREVAQA